MTDTSTNGQHPQQPTSTSTDEQPTADDSKITTSVELPTTAIELIEDGNHERPPSEDDNPQAALELVRDALVLLDSGTYTTTLQRGTYEVVVTTTPADQGQATEFAVHLDCITNTHLPNPNNPGTAVQTSTALWVCSDERAREIVRNYLGADALDEFTPKEEDR